MWSNVLVNRFHKGALLLWPPRTTRVYYRDLLVVLEALMFCCLGPWSMLTLGDFMD